VSALRGLAPVFARPRLGDAPVGTVVAFAGQLGPPDPPGPAMASPPVGTTSPIEAWGWMACDGRSLTTALYPELFQALAYLYGGKDGSFNLPNYGGYFLRGVDEQAKIDPDPRSPPSPGADAAGVGSTQGFALQSHEHVYSQSALAGPVEEGTDAGAPGQASTNTGGPVTASDLGAADVQVSLKETRPVNIAVNYIIKFTIGLGLTWPGHPDRGE
jgi:hypothetical protein